MNPQFVLFHRPGRAWLPGVSFLEQPGLQGHVDHFRRCATEGLLLAGGPFLDEGGGGMVMFKAGVTQEQALQVARTDPTFESGLLEYELRPWFSAPWAGVITSS
jgi:uncharacterized protein YciI